jgi:hypothetical protein
MQVSWGNDTFNVTAAVPAGWSLGNMQYKTTSFVVQAVTRCVRLVFGCGVREPMMAITYPRCGALS